MRSEPGGGGSTDDGEAALVVSLTRWRGVTLLALAGTFVAVYMLLYSLGVYGALICGVGSCDVVQASRWSRFLGLPVAGWGVAWYVAVLAVCAVGLRGGTAAARVEPALAVLASAGLAFSVYLTGLELFVIEAICLWCVISAGLTLGIFVLAAPWRTLRRRATPRD